MTAISHEAVLAPAGRNVPRWLAWIGMFCRRQPIAAASAVVLMIIIMMAILAPVLQVQPPNEQNLDDRLANPSWEHPLGGDELGRDD